MLLCPISGLRTLLFILFTITLIACGDNDTSEIDLLREDITRLQEDITRLEALISAEKHPTTEENNTPSDTSQIVFVHDGIYIMGANGQNIKLIYNRLASVTYGSEFIVRPKWSHDGTKIVFMSPSMREGFSHNDICIISADGSNPTPYTNRVVSSVRNPVWTSQGEIVYEGSDNGGYWQGLLLGFARIRGDSFQADYRADGTLVFVKDRKRKDSKPNIYTFDPLMERERRLTFESDSYPTWSPDGTKIVFVRTIAQNDIFVMNADGSFPRNLTQHPADDKEPTWSPDGTHIAFVSDRETFEPHIWTMETDGTNLNKLHPGRAPDWR